MTKQEREIRRLMALGLSRKQATARLPHLQIKAWDEQARNAEMVKTYHSERLGSVTIPEE